MPEDAPGGQGPEQQDTADGAAGARPLPTERPRRRRGLRVAIVGLVTLALLVIGSAAAYFAFLNWRVSENITQQPLMPGQGQPEAGGGAGGEAGGEDGSEPVERDPSSGEAMNILLLGSDTRDLSTDRGRSDVIVLAHIDDERDRVDLIHFPRDYFVDIAGDAGMNKVNAAYASGGAPLLVQTLEPLIDVPVDHVALVNFESFKAMTDAIGGVDVRVAEASPGFETGVRHMDGATGLRFVRERYALSQGDISRGQRQQAFIKGIMLEGLSRQTLTNPARLARFVDAATENLVVDQDLDVGDMRDLAFELRGLRGDDIYFSTAPWTGIGDDEVAGSIVIPSEDQLGQLSEHLRTDSMESYTDDVSPKQGFGG